jgi:hypothetical protein
MFYAEQKDELEFEKAPAFSNRLFKALQIAKSYHKVFKTGAYCYLYVTKW